MNRIYIKFLIELRELLGRYHVELYKSAVDGKQKVEFDEDYAKQIGLTTNVFTVSDKNVITYDIVNKNVHDHSLYDAIYKEFAYKVLYIVRTKTGKLKVYNNRPHKLFGYWIGSNTHIKLPDNLYPTLKYDNYPVEVFLNIIPAS